MSTTTPSKRSMASSSSLTEESALKRSRASRPSLTIPAPAPNNSRPTTPRANNNNNYNNTITTTTTNNNNNNNNNTNTTDDDGDDYSLNVNLLVHHRYQSVSFHTLLTLPPSAFRGLPSAADTILSEYGVKTIGDIAQWRLYRTAFAIHTAAFAEERNKRNKKSKANVHKAFVGFKAGGHNNHQSSASSSSSHHSTSSSSSSSSLSSSSSSSSSLSSLLESYSFRQILQSPLSILIGSGPSLSALKLKTVADLAQWKYGKLSEALTIMMNYENEDFSSF